MAFTVSPKVSLPAGVDPNEDLLPIYIINLPSPFTKTYTQETEEPKSLHQKILSALRSNKHNARNEQRSQRDEENKYSHERQKEVRLAMVRASETLIPQLVGWDGDPDMDEDVVEVYVLPPRNQIEQDGGRAEDLERVRDWELREGENPFADAPKRKRYVMYETGIRLVGGGNRGEYDRAMAMAGMGLALS